MVLTGTEN